MNLITRNDTSLAIGLIVGSVVAFQQPLHFILDAARDVEERYQLDLIPALTVVASVYIFHQYRKRLLSKAEAAAASAEAARASARSQELERLMTFSHDLVRVLDVAILQQVLWKNLPPFTRGRGFWMVVRVGGRWQEVLQDATRAQKRSLDELEAMADAAVAGTGVIESKAGVANADGLCFPLFAGEEAIGVLGIDNGADLASDDREAIGTASGLIAIALRNVRLFEQTRDQSIRDRLTGCFNHEQCLQTLDVELRRARRSGRPLSIVMFDIDHFKTINDELGHLRGDEILRAVGAQLNRKLRATDVSNRYGGDEFLIILPDTDLPGAERVAEMLRHEISTLLIPAAADQILALTASIGVATAEPGELDVSMLVKRADAALYRAKTAGRNRACVALPSGAAAEPEAPPADPDGLLESVPGGTETILVADDEPLMQEFIQRCLARRGYTILQVRNAVDAIAVAAARRGPIDLLLADVVMPDLLGPDLAERIRRARPEIRVLFISGFVDHPAVLERHAADGSFLQKPFTAGALAAKVREVLDAAAARDV